MDATSFWVTFHQRKNIVLQIIVALLIFGVGWQVGRVMSPYYASHPIVFEENGTALSGQPEQLAALQQAGIAAREVAQVTPTKQPEVAAAQATALTSLLATPATPAEKAKLYVASVNSDKYHHRECSASNQIKEENKVWFSSPAEAEQAGYTASKCTQDRSQATP